MAFTDLGQILPPLLLLFPLGIAVSAVSIIFGLLAYALATLVVCMLNDLGFDVIERFENYFSKKNWRSAFDLTVLVGTSMTASNKEKAYLKEKNDLAAEGALLVQRQIYLAEEMEKKPRENEDGAVQSVNEAKSREMVDELEKLSAKLQENWTKLKELLRKQPKGVMIREDMRKSPSDYLRDGRAMCKARNGCCARDCQCCDKARIWRDYHTDRPPVYLYSHCTNECGCCIRLEKYVFSCEPNKVLENSEIQPETYTQDEKS
ncbi:uncharacterized protein N7469_008016 [Penicillium citrinum]|uniref:Uncharacterized protein n=1 Tax=Penicillium citrinum TaxID=5077 RepID=A0A9W9NT42_PENCI|nr:uncharacterized protein N7469_008016 [Penicillium citrinum]KAJ5224513.1 hypothetical protein N7469_008016 [Penicillium citrinum]KAK5796061.1 hypothetical protein VI817_005346 [Penicillium citrinum]